MAMSGKPTPLRPGLQDRPDGAVRFSPAPGDRGTVISATIEHAPPGGSLVISHRLPLDEAPRGYRIFRDKEEDCTKVVLKP